MTGRLGALGASWLLAALGASWLLAALGASWLLAALGALWLLAVPVAALVASGTCLQAASDMIVPLRATVLAEASLPERKMLAAVLDNDAAAIRRLVGADRALLGAGWHEWDLLALAASRCHRDTVEALLALGAPSDGLRAVAPLSYGIAATEPWLAMRLLDAGASPQLDEARRRDPLLAAIMLGSPGAVRLLLDRGADVNRVDTVGGSPLDGAVGIARLDIAELLLDRGADPWTIDGTGTTVGIVLTRMGPLRDAGEETVRQRLLARLRDVGFPSPSPTPREGRDMIVAGTWPPSDAAGARPVPPHVVELARARLARDRARERD